MVEYFGALFLTLIGGWVLAIPFYGFALYALTQREWSWLYCWLGVFGVMAIWALYDGVYRRSLFDQRAMEFSQIVKYAEPPPAIRTIAYIDMKGRPESRAYGCGRPCLNLLLSGRFDRVVLRYPNPAATDPDAKLEAIRSNVTIPNHYYAIFTLVERGAGCPVVQAYDDQKVLAIWERFGRCVARSQIATLDEASPRLEVRLNDDAPHNPPWTVQAIDVRLIDGKQAQPIGRVEHADIFLSGLSLWPVIYPRGGGLKPNFGIGLAPKRRHYGPTVALYPALSQILGLDLAIGRLPLPPRAN